MRGKLFFFLKLCFGLVKAVVILSGALEKNIQTMSNVHVDFEQF